MVIYAKKTKCQIEKQPQADKFGPVVLSRKKYFPASLFEMIDELEEDQLVEMSDSEMPAADFRRMIAEADVNNDGYIDRAEFRQMVINQAAIEARVKVYEFYLLE